MGVLVIRMQRDDIESCSDWLWQLGATAIEERDDAEKVHLIVGFGDDDLALAARSVLSERWPCRFESTGDEAAWRDEWLKWIEPIQVANFVVHAPWHDPELWASWDVPHELSIDPGRAFGSGHHPTTQLALRALAAAVAPGSRVLDVGCGTGILSIAAAKLEAASVTGIDLDYDILEVAAANSEANGTASHVQLATDPLEAIDDRFDIVVANIVIGDLRPLVPTLLERTRGVTILSGFLDDQLDTLLVGTDARPVNRATLDGWACATIAPR